MQIGLLNINDDCLLEIFKHLTFPELADISSICTRFQTIARKSFSLRLKSDPVCINVAPRDLSYDRYLKRRRQIGAFLRNFGDILTNVKVNFWHTHTYTAKLCNTFVYNMMVKYCIGTLQRLELRNCEYLQPDKIIDSRALFRHVKELILFKSQAIIGCFLHDAKQLTRLKLQLFHFSDVNQILSNNYPRLQTLTLNQPQRRDRDDEIDIIGFLKRHRYLNELEFVGGCGNDLSRIGKYRRLRKLTIWNCPGCDILPIAQLNKLTTLKLSIGCGGESPRALLMASKSSQSLQELGLSGYSSYSRSVSMGLKAALPRFTNLNQLSFNYNDVDDDLLRVLHRLESLHVLSIGAQFYSSITTNGFVDLVQRLPQLEQLTLHPAPYGNLARIELLESTYLQICKIYRNRKQKLVIYNFDISNKGLKEIKHKKPFAGFVDQHEFVQFIILDVYSTGYNNVKI